MTLRIKESALHSNHEAQGKSTCLLKTIEHPALLPFPFLSIQKNRVKLCCKTVCGDLRELTFLLQTYVLFGGGSSQI